MHAEVVMLSKPCRPPAGDQGTKTAKQGKGKTRDSAFVGEVQVTPYFIRSASLHSCRQQA